MLTIWKLYIEKFHSIYIIKSGILCSLFHEEGKEDRTAQASRLKTSRRWVQPNEARLYVGRAMDGVRFAGYFNAIKKFQMTLIKPKFYLTY